MSPPKTANFAERYDRALRRHQLRDHSPAYPVPHPTADWPPENIAFLERYEHWLLAGGASEMVAYLYYLPMAGHVLGLTLKLHSQLDPDTDLQCAQDYIEARMLSATWTKNCRNALLKLRCFLRSERGLGETHTATPFDVHANTQGLPAWLVSELQRYQHRCQHNWRPARLNDSIRRFWGEHLRLWRFFCEQCEVRQLSDLNRRHLIDYLDHRLAAGRAVSGINGELHTLQAFLAFLQEAGYAVPQALLRLKGLKPPETLPKFLTDEQVRKLCAEIERHTAQATLARHRRNALLTRAAFYLLWQSGLRLGEVEELRQEDLDLPAHRLTVRNGKGLKDRTVYLTDITVTALKEYLAVRGPGAADRSHLADTAHPGDHVFLYRNQTLRKGLIRDRIQAIGQWAGVKVHPHRLRHTCATQLLNAGCPITSIQKFLGHKSLDTTMIYAKVHDQTVASDYYAAMERVEARLDIVPRAHPLETLPQPVSEPARSQLRILTGQLAEPKLDLEERLLLVAQMRTILFGEAALAPSGDTSTSSIPPCEKENPPPSS